MARLSQGLGNATNNAAEYGGAKLGLEYARDNGYTHVRMQGDSQLVTNQVLILICPDLFPNNKRCC